MTYRRKDAYYRRARAAGYRARSAYKLSQLDSRFRLLRRGDVVVDLGAWPGGWLQVALEAVGPHGRVVGVDLVAIDPLGSPNLRLVGGDVRDPSTWRAVLEHLGRPADVVLSDLAPKLSGGGNLLIKLFMGGSFDLATAELHRRFEEFRSTRPAATRKASAEVYGVARGYRGVPAS